MLFVRLFLAAAAVAAVAVAPASARPTAKAAKAEAELARVVAGRVAGEPVDCISLHRIRDVEIIDRTAIVYDGGSTVWVNRPEGGVRQLSDWDVLVTEPFGSRLCDLDTVRLYDRTSWFPKGFVNLGKFVPYRKVGSGRR
jgi:hypothetical protein